MTKSIEIFKFLYAMPGKQRVLQVRGEQYSSIEDISDERVQRVVKQSIAEMVDMAGGIEKLIEEGVLQPADNIRKSEKEDVQTSEKSEQEKGEAGAEIVEMGKEQEIKSKPINRPPLINPQLKPVQTTPERPVEPGGGSLLNRFRNLASRKVEKDDPILPTLDLAGQINKVLLTKIDGKDAFLGRQIELKTAVNGDLLFVIDGLFYESVNDIPDQESADLFRSAIAAWEKQQG